MPGIIDWWTIKDREVKKLADWHPRLNIIALLIFIASFYLRTSGGAHWIGGSLTIPVLLSVLGIILITISGWLGGEMVYVHGAAVEPRQDAAPE